MLPYKGKTPLSFVKMVYKSLWAVLFAMFSVDPKDPRTKLGKLAECCSALLMILGLHLIVFGGLAAGLIMLFVAVVYVVEWATPILSAVLGIIFFLWCLLPDRSRVQQAQQRHQEFIPLPWKELASTIVMPAVQSEAVKAFDTDDLIYYGEMVESGYYFNLDSAIFNPLDSTTQGLVRRRIAKQLAKQYQLDYKKVLRDDMVKVECDSVFIAVF